MHVWQIKLTLSVIQNLGGGVLCDIWTALSVENKNTDVWQWDYGNGRQP